MYADMGIFTDIDQSPPPATARHNIGNLIDDLAAGRVDFAVHSGDHAYEFEVSGGARGDGKPLSLLPPFSPPSSSLNPLTHTNEFLSDMLS